MPPEADATRRALGREATSSEAGILEIGCGWSGCGRKRERRRTSVDFAFARTV